MRRDVAKRRLLRGKGHRQDDDVRIRDDIHIGAGTHSMAQFRGGLFRTFGVARSDRHGIAGTRQPPGDRSAQITGAADDGNGGKSHRLSFN